ncbi:hypothetical protein IF2G_04949 [Cordyceps javanica]|nr:hypothetical protein IF2G_04949 [Cordyceps javanica]
MPFMSSMNVTNECHQAGRKAYLGALSNSFLSFELTPCMTRKKSIFSASTLEYEKYATNRPGSLPSLSETTGLSRNSIVKAGCHTEYIKRRWNGAFLGSLST